MNEVHGAVKGAVEHVGLDRQYAELIEVVWSCERQWSIDDRVDAAIKYGRG